MLMDRMKLSAEKLNAIYGILYSTVRRTPHLDGASAYISLANAGKRLTSGISHGIRRVGHFDRSLTSVKNDLADERRRLEAKAAAKREKETSRFQRLASDPDEDAEEELESLTKFSGSSATEDLDDLYGEES